MPLISIIVPCYNEEWTVRLLLEAIAGQTYPGKDIEIVIADAGSTDKTRETIAAYQQENPTLEIRVIENPMRAIPIGLNIALAEARGEFIIRLDAHSIPYPDYITRCISALEQGLGDNVGGVWEIKPLNQSWVAKSIAAAASHPFGAGDARYRIGGSPGEVDTVPFGAYSKDLAEKLGGYDESLLTNEDYEFNVRIRKSGGRVWLDPMIRTIYFARGTFQSLAKQYWRYGYWKARMLLKHPETIRWRQMAAILVLTIVILAGLSIWFPLARGLLLAELAFYTGLLFVAGIQTSIRNRAPGSVIGVPLAIIIMHFAWGTAFLWSLIQFPFQK